VDRLIIAVVLTAVAIAVALIAQRRRDDPPTQPGNYHIPAQLDRKDFLEPDKPWLVAVFTSATCATCADAWSKATVMASDKVAVHNIEVGADADLHARYRIDGVPAIVVADADGVVRCSFLGPPRASELWGAVADAREP